MKSDKTVSGEIQCNSHIALKLGQLGGPGDDDSRAYENNGTANGIISVGGQ